MSGSITFTVLGKPEPAGSKRAFVHPVTKRSMVVDANRKAAPWKQQVAGAALNRATSVLHGPVSLDVTFVLARPKGHYGTGRNSSEVKPSAPPFPATRPDTTKLLRGVEDAITGIVWKDDAQVVEQSARKVYGTPERCEVTIRPLGGQQ